MISLHSVIPASKQNIFHDLSASVLKPQSHLSCILVTSASILTVAAAAGGIYWATCLRKAPTGNQNRMQEAKATPIIEKKEERRTSPYSTPQNSDVKIPSKTMKERIQEGLAQPPEEKKETKEKGNANLSAIINGDSTEFMSQQCDWLLAGTNKPGKGLGLN